MCLASYKYAMLVLDLKVIASCRCLIFPTPSHAAMCLGLTDDTLRVMAAPKVLDFRTLLSLLICLLPGRPPGSHVVHVTYPRGLVKRPIHYTFKVSLTMDA